MENVDTNLRNICSQKQRTMQQKSLTNAAVFYANRTEQNIQKFLYSTCKTKAGPLARSAPKKDISTV